MIFISKETLRNDHYYIGSRPTVDTALIPLCHTCFSKENQLQPICMTGSVFMHIVDISEQQKQYHVRKREIIRDLRLILEKKAPNFTSNRLGGCVRLELSNIFTSLQSSFLLLSNIVYSKGEHLSYSASLGKDMNAKAL
jgi:hypothetical protein